MQRVRNALARFTANVVPGHLQAVYFADFALFLSALGLIERFFGANSLPQALISGGAIAAAVLLFVGWAWDTSTYTKRGAWVMMGVWAGQLAFLTATFGDQILNEAREAANLTFGAAFFVLASGLWWATVAGKGERGLWWLRHQSPSA